MKNIFNTVTGLLFLMSLGGCELVSRIQDCEEDSAPQVLTFFEDEFENFPWSLQNINLDDKEVNLVIKTQAEYEKYFISSKDLPDIDFGKFIILAGRYRHHQCAVFDRQQILLCDSRLFYKVRIIPQDCQAITDVFYSAVIERKYEDLPIIFNVNLIDL
ncbi:hypothetical protein [Indibacter alkaliphilus]|uniref:hypothetical protein n=1 Tax=Indibacter alkaliphilus TaxID=579922 RepID=UPI0002823568|nr:hypothetical protein [Indibacter alkaliphilus]